MRASSWMRAAALGAVLTVGSVVAAPSEARADDAAVVEAQARFNEGLALADQGKNEEARLKFTQAVAVLKAPAVLFNLARVEQLTGHELEAVEHYKQFLRAAANDPKVTDATRDKARGYIAELSKKAGQIDVDAPMDARVTIDGRPVEERSTDPVHVAPGRHTVEGTYQGKVRSVTVECSAGQVTKATFDFAGGATTEPPREETKGYWTTGRAVGLGLGVVGIGAAVAGVIVFTGANGKSDDAASIRERLPDPRSSCAGAATISGCSELKTLEDDYKSGRTLGSVLMISGGALAVGGVALLLIAGPNKSEPTRGTSRLVPVATAREAGFSWVGTF